MKIKDQLMAVLSFGLNDTTFDEYAEEFGVTLSEGVIRHCLFQAKDKNVQNLLIEQLFLEIIRNCISDCGLDNKNHDFKWEANGVASYIEYKGTRYTNKNALYEAARKDYGK